MYMSCNHRSIYMHSYLHFPLAVILISLSTPVYKCYASYISIMSKQNSLEALVSFILNKILPLSVDSKCKYKFIKHTYMLFTLSNLYFDLSFYSSLQMLCFIYFSNEQSKQLIVIWDPEGGYQYSKMFHWETEGRYYSCTKSMAIAPIWFSTEHLWIVIAPFWLSTDKIQFWSSWVIYF